MLEGACHCGQVRIAAASAPRALTDCNCSICRRLGTLWAWAYYPPAEVRIAGATRQYVWGDRKLAFHHCPACGCATHWSSIAEPPEDRMGVNFRMMPRSALEGLRVRRFDGADTWRYLDD